jgi:predicted AAA+ superfamily ATPase
MKSILNTCQPRPELLAGNFNPEVFTASLGPIIEYYHNGRNLIDSIYTNADLFFREATYPTQGLRYTLAEVFGRLAGDMTVPAIHRLETAFGGGKTHTLIACTHIAFRGTELRSVISDILDPALLPEPGSVTVVGVAGDEIPVHRPQGDALVPYTLWGEIAFQLGGERLYREVEDEANSHAAPGRTYFDKVFANRKALIMLDELAQYAARLEAARPDGASQLAAFLMALHGYARNHPGIAVILTLASATDAFAKQTERLAQLVGQVRGEEMSEDDALGIGERALKGVASVVARDAVQITPVQAAEISSVLATTVCSD